MSKARLHEKWMSLLAAAWPHREERLIVWRPSGLRAPVLHDGQFWMAALPPGAHPGLSRYWNPAGLYTPAGGLRIAVEFNIPSPSNTTRVSAFFAEDAQTGRAYLMHDGAIGGGFPGVGRAAFLHHAALKLVPVRLSDRSFRPAVIVAPLERNRLAGGLVGFIRQVVQFKQAVRNQTLPADRDTREDEQTYEQYLREFSGRKAGQRADSFEYISRHGDIVEALRQWRARYVRAHERVFNSQLIDLGVYTHSEGIREVYEVKTSAERQDLYTAIGQLLTHGTNSTRRFVVLPSGPSLAKDLERALKRLSIEVLRFTLTPETVSIQAQSR